MVGSTLAGALRFGSGAFADRRLCLVGVVEEQGQQQGELCYDGADGVPFPRLPAWWRKRGRAYAFRVAGQGGGGLPLPGS
jgi:aryl carrier-like protein